MFGTRRSIFPFRYASDSVQSVGLWPSPRQEPSSLKTFVRARRNTFICPSESGARAGQLDQRGPRRAIATPASGHDWRRMTMRPRVAASGCSARRLPRPSDGAPAPTGPATDRPRRWPECTSGRARSIRHWTRPPRNERPAPHAACSSPPRRWPPGCPCSGCLAATACGAGSCWASR